MTNTETTTKPAAPRTVQGGLLCPGDVVVWRGAVVRVRGGDTSTVLRTCTVWDRSTKRERTIRVPRTADVEVVALANQGVAACARCGHGRSHERHRHAGGPQSDARHYFITGLY